MKSDRVRWRPAWRMVMLAVSRRFRPEHMQHSAVFGELLANQLSRKMMKEKQREGKAQCKLWTCCAGRWTVKHVLHGCKLYLLSTASLSSAA